MKILKIVGGVAVAAVVLFVGAVFAQPAHMHVERSKVVAAAPGDVFPLVNDFSHWADWSPWHDLDPNQKLTLSANPVGKGASYAWEGNDQVGKGRMEIVESVADQKVVETLEFIEPFQTKATVTFTFAPEGEGTKVVWGYDEDCGFMSRAAGMFMDMDMMLGSDFEKGLGRLAPHAETAAKARMAAEAEAKAAAEAAAAQVVADGTAPAGEAAPPAP